jgi:hypothetical protein
MALLLGASTGTKVSRYESFGRHPSVLTVFAYEIILNQPARELFAGTYESVRRDVQLRAARLIKNLAPQSADPEISRKVELLRAIVGNQPGATHQTS